MLVLNDLRDKPRATKNYKRVGRGKSGKRPGHGGKGQTARTGVALGNFQGGQTPIERRLPKTRSFSVGEKLATVSLKSIDRLIDAKKLSAQEITFDMLKHLNVIKKVSKFKLVGDQCANKFTIEVNAVSNGAKLAIEKVMGSVRLVK